jgi:serine/threonine protein kinase
MEKIITRIKNNKKFTPKAIDRITLPVGLKKRLVSWNNGSKRVDVDKLIIALRNVKLGKVQKGGGCLKIGSGSYGTVYKLNDDVCIKIINNDQDNQIINTVSELMNLEGVEKFSTFLKILPNTIINNCIEHSTVGSTWYYIKYCNQGDLLKYIESFDNGDKNMIDINMLKTNINNCLVSLDFFTSRHYIHGDIKLDNILMNNNNWLLHDFDFCTRVDNSETYQFSAFTPYYISPFLMNVNKEIKSDVYLNNYARLHTLLTNGSTNSFTNMMNTGKCDSPSDIRDYDFYEQMIDMYYVNINLYGQKKHKGIFSHLVNQIESDNSLKMLNLLKSDYYSLGVVIFYIYYKIKKEKIAHLEDYADNTLQPLMVLCLIPFYTTCKFNYEMLKHGEFIQYCISKFNDEVTLDNPMYYDIYKDMFELQNGGTIVPIFQSNAIRPIFQLNNKYIDLWRKGALRKTQLPSQEKPNKFDFGIGISDTNITNHYINDDKIIMKEGGYYKYETVIKRIMPADS